MQKNRKTLIPFLMAGTFTVMIFNILQSLAYCPYIYYKGVEAFYGAQTIAIILDISSQITAVFAVLFLFYANQFLIKGRKKEMGLYGVLGMSKKNITYIYYDSRNDPICADLYGSGNDDRHLFEQTDAVNAV